MSMPSATPLRPEPNWYTDPETPTLERFWDGSAWTSDVRPLGVMPLAVAQPTTSSNTLSIIAIVLGVLAVLFLPIVFGPAALILAGLGKSKGEKLATIALVVAGLGMALGIGLGILVGVAAV